jgi:6-phosphogluconolactonase
MALTENLYASVDELNAKFSQRICVLLKQGIAENGRASLIVSGGRTPVAVFNALSNMDIAWDKVDISLADERWVEPNDDASNEKMLRANLLKGKAAKANYVGLKTSHSNAIDGVVECASNLRNIHTPFDVVILGMGEDGHTASLFPCSEQIAQGLDLNSGQSYIAVQPTTAPNQRMSLTLPAIIKSKHIFLHLTGENKKRVLEDAKSGSDEFAMPIRAVLNNADVELVWAP